MVGLSPYPLLDYLAGEEKSSYMPKNDTVSRYQVFSDTMLILLDSYLSQGGNLFISGAHIASDVHQMGQDSVVAKLLKYTWRTSNASRLGEFYFMDPELEESSSLFSFNTGYQADMYTVEGADALEPADSSSTTLLRYSENNMSAGIAYRGDYGVVAFGFPFETIMDPEERDLILRKILAYLLETDEHEKD